MRASRVTRMSSAGLFAWTFFSGLVLASPSAASSFFGIEFSPVVETRVFGNGLRAAAISDSSSPTAAAILMFCRGSSSDLSGRSGTAHLLEHMMYRSVGSLSEGEYEATIRRRGGERNAFTSPDATGYYFAVSREALDEALSMESRRWREALESAAGGEAFREEEFVIERDVVSEERRLAIDSDAFASFREAADDALWHPHPYGRSTAGARDEIATLRREDLRDFLLRGYAPSEAVISVAGGFESERLLERLASTMGTIPPPRVEGSEASRGFETARGREGVSLFSPLRRFDSRAGAALTIRGYRLAPSSVTGAGSDAEAFRLLSHVLGGSSTSRLYSVAARDRGIATATGAIFSDLRDGAAFVVYGVPPSEDSPTRESVDAALDALDETMESELSRLASEPVGEEELADAKTALISGFLYGLDDPRSLARMAASSACRGRPADYAFSAPRRLAETDAERIMRAAKSLIASREAIAARLYPFDEDDDS